MKTINVNCCAECPHCHWRGFAGGWLCTELGVYVEIVSGGIDPDCPLDDAKENDGKREGE